MFPAFPFLMKTKRGGFKHNLIHVRINDEDYSCKEIDFACRRQPDKIQNPVVSDCGRILILSGRGYRGQRPMCGLRAASPIGLRADGPYRVKGETPWPGTGRQRLCRV